MRYIFIFTISIIISGFACRDKNIIGHEDLRLKFNNSSEMALYASYAYSYPDTSIDSYDITNAPYRHKAEINSTITLIADDSWGKIFLHNIDSDTLMVFVFDAHVLETTPWDTVKANYLVLKRYDLSLQDLENMNWTITYP